jgi:hypothetical protein
MRRSALAEFLRRLVAAGSAALVLALAIFAASPDLHGRLHGHDHCPVHEKNADDSADHTCAITLFAGGLPVPHAALDLAPGAAAWHAQPPAVAERIFLTTPRYLRQPERGPPIG